MQRPSRLPTLLEVTNVAAEDDLRVRNRVVRLGVMSASVSEALHDAKGAEDLVVDPIHIDGLSSKGAHDRSAFCIASQATRCDDGREPGVTVRSDVQCVLDPPPLNLSRTQRQQCEQPPIRPLALPVARRALRDLVPDLSFKLVGNRTDQVVLSREDVAQGARDDLGRFGDLPDGQGLDAAGRNSPPRRLDQLAPSGVVVNQLWHPERYHARRFVSTRSLRNRRPGMARIAGITRVSTGAPAWSSLHLRAARC